MNKKEKEIIKYLRYGKRVNISKIARDLHLPTSTVSDRIKRIEQKYVFKRSSILNFEKMGYFANAMIAAKINQKQKKDFLNFLKSQKCINSIFFINSGFSFLFEIIFKDNLELINWIEELKSNFNLELIQFQILKTENKEIFMEEEK
jgi:DNA-binding Lrp family transcriptional regulator